jgi:urea transport system ATP-binding protein
LRARHRTTSSMMEKGRVVVAGAIAELSDEMVHRHMAV